MIEGLKTKLGWCIVGPIVINRNGEALRCNSIAVKDAITGKLLSHHFVKDTGYKMRDIGVEEMFRKINQNDFCEDVHLSTRGILGDMEEISKDDKMFLAIVERGTKKVDEHYEVPLPYRDGNLQLRNNKNQAIRRMQQLTVEQKISKESRVLQQLHQADRRAYFKGVCKTVIQ